MCGAIVPLVKQTWLCKKKGRYIRDFLGCIHFIFCRWATRVPEATAKLYKIKYGATGNPRLSFLRVFLDFMENYSEFCAIFDLIFLWHCDTMPAGLSPFAAPRVIRRVTHAI
jgi:hypothetical protein